MKSQTATTTTGGVVDPAASFTQGHVQSVMQAALDDPIAPLEFEKADGIQLFQGEAAAEMSDWSLALTPPQRCWRAGRPVGPEPRHYEGADVVLLPCGSLVFRSNFAVIPLIFRSYSSVGSQTGLARVPLWRIRTLY